jgi:hypothetical protein
MLEDRPIDFPKESERHFAGRKHTSESLAGRLSFFTILPPKNAYTFPHVAVGAHLQAALTHILNKFCDK